VRVTEIIPGKLYQSARFNRSGLSQEEKLQFLQEYGIDVVVSLVDFDPDMPDICYYIQSSQPDSHRIDFLRMQEIASEVSRLLDNGFVALVHCNGGRNRSGLVNTLVVMQQLGLTGRAALDYVRKMRPNAVATTAFEDFLNSL
jgi:protein-tyrosine phosphatase